MENPETVGLQETAIVVARSGNHVALPVDLTHTSTSLPSEANSGLPSANNSSSAQLLD